MIEKEVYHKRKEGKIMSKVVVLGSINVDFTTQVNVFPKAGETVRGEHFKVTAGGKGANQAVACAKMGAEVAMIGKVGEDSYSSFLIDQLKDAGVNTKHVLKEGISGRTFINVDANGENTITYVPGANEMLTENEIEAMDELLDEAAFLVLQQEISPDMLKFVLKKVRSKKCQVLLNAAPSQAMEEDYLSFVDTLVVNEVELAYLLNQAVSENTHEINKELDVLLAKGVQKIIVTLGSKGSLFKNRDHFFETPAYKVKAIDTTGAGDTFIGAYVSCKAQGKTDREAINFATAASACTVTKAGAQDAIPTEARVKQFLSNKR